MDCPSCHFVNQEGWKFCQRCGTPLPQKCPQCNTDNPPQARFCAACGTPLLETPLLALAQPTSEDQVSFSIFLTHKASQAERRQLTLLFCDLVDSTALSGQLDPEDLREVLRAYHTICTEVIQRFDGYVAQYLGDGLLVYFGYPQAHEDDAQRAIRTGLGIVEAIRDLNRSQLIQKQNIQLAVRVGIHTGLVVVGEIGERGRQEQLALGETPNITARIQGLAEPNNVLISAATYRLVQGYFTMKELGDYLLKGVTTPVRLYIVLQESTARNRLEVAVTRGLTPLIGREMEVRRLYECWEQVKQGKSQRVLLSGEAGIGKSRLVQVLKEHVAQEASPILECRCSPYHQHSAFYPLIDLWSRLFQFTAEDSLPQKHTKMEQVLSSYALPQDAIFLFTDLLSLPYPSEGFPTLSLLPQRQKQKTLEAMQALLNALANQQPLLFIVEDLHWVDPSTLEFLYLLVEQPPQNRLYIVLTSRPDFQAQWSAHPSLSLLTLPRLTPQQVTIMAEQVANQKTLPAVVTYQIIQKTDGVPLFVEELTKMILESSLLREETYHYELQGSLPPLAVPATLSDSLMARLDRLGPVKALVQLGATLGRSFSYPLLQAVSLLDESTLRQALKRLVEAELLYQQGTPPQATYTFKHALIQEAAYHSLLKSTRQRYHQQIASILESQFSAMIVAQPELVAYHYTEAGLHEKAIAYWQQAGQRSVERSANKEAIVHFTKALELLNTLPDTPTRAEKELALRVALGVPLLAIQGFASPDVAQLYERARVLCQQVGDHKQLFPVLFGLWSFYDVRGDLQTARELAEQLLFLTQNLQDSIYLLIGHRAVGDTLHWLGELGPARDHLEKGVAFSKALQPRSTHQAYLYGQDPAVGCRIYLASTLWPLGYPDQALHRAQEAFSIAYEISHPFSIAFATNLLAQIHQYRGEISAMREYVESLLVLADEQGFAHWSAMGSVLRGWVLFQQGQTDEGIVQMHKGLAAYEARGAQLSRPYYLALLAEAYGKRGELAKGIALLEEALTLVAQRGIRYYAAELYRLKGELLLKFKAKGEGKKGKVEKAVAEVEDCFWYALNLARHQQAKSWELRTALSLSRLWLQQGQASRARFLLEPLYNWFIEGLNTADLQETRALLGLLS